MKKPPATPLPEWVIALVAALQDIDAKSPYLTAVPEHVRQTARRWTS